jgi:hypothetical protein
MERGVKEKSCIVQVSPSCQFWNVFQFTLEPPPRRPFCCTHVYALAFITSFLSPQHIPLPLRTIQRSQSAFRACPKGAGGQRGRKTGIT